MSVQYEAGPVGKGVWYSIPLYTPADAVPPRELVASLAEPGEQQLFCIAMCWESEGENEHPMADVMNPELWPYTKKWLMHCCADSNPENTVRTFVDAYNKRLTVAPVNCQECGRPHIERKSQE